MRVVGLEETVGGRCLHTLTVRRFSLWHFSGRGKANEVQK